MRAFRACVTALSLAGCVCLLSANVFATIMRGVEVYGREKENEFPIIVRDSVNAEGKGAGGESYITIQFDAVTSDPTGIRIRFFHCNRNWEPDNNLFVQDQFHNTSHLLNYEPSPNGVHGYTYRFVNHFPDRDDIVRFEYSGNWIFRIMDNSGDSVFYEGRFFVVDRLVPVKIAVANDYVTANVSPMNQAHAVTVQVQLHDETEGLYFTTVDVYQNRRFRAPFRIDAMDRDSYTFVEGIGRGYREFSIRNILPGNEYRTFDFGDANRYPNGTPVRSLEGADQVRLYWRTGPDRDGTAGLNRYTGINSDYLDVVFRLDMTETDRRNATTGGRGIFLVGPFNDWDPMREDLLAYDEQERSLVAKEYLRRGIYDYQYVTGIWNEDSGVVEQQDWTALEGNDWRTTNTYVAMVYYNEPRFGGFDRIVGMARGASGGSANPSPR
jgi:hypothetical protein